ncbi:hypothetical protein ACI78V_15145 [Geodermatophilus sp. SYSU D00742]
MSETARTALTVVCYSVAVLAQLAALAILVAEGRRAGAALRRWRDAEPGPATGAGPPSPTAVVGPPGTTAVVGPPGTTTALVPTSGPATDRRRADRAALVDPLLGNAFDRTSAVVLLVVGVVVGTIGHLLSL